MSNIHKQGFGSMHPDKQREIAARGGKAAQAKGTAHRSNHEEAKAAGRIGGKAYQGKRKNI